MPLTPQTSHELAKSYKERCRGELSMVETADLFWWLDKFDQLLIEKQERIEKVEWFAEDAFDVKKRIINILKN